MYFLARKSPLKWLTIPTNKFSSNKKNVTSQNTNDSTNNNLLDVEGFTGELKRQRQRDSEYHELTERKKAELNKIVQYYEANRIDFTLYMRHDCPRSQYIFALMNFNSLGFKKISNLAYLDAYTYAQKELLRNISDDERWPLLKIEEGLTPADIIKGENQIREYMTANHFFRFYDHESASIQPTLQFIKSSIERPLQVIFWNPVLTAQYSFDGDAESYRKGARSYILFGVIRMNVTKVVKRSFRNMINIFRNPEQYRASRTKLLQGLKQWMDSIPKGQDYCGGSEPNHCDFYLYSLFLAKLGSRFFVKFIDQQTPKQFRSWFRRMDSRCRFQRQRLTIL